MLLNCCLEKTLESPLDSKIKTVSPKGNQPWMIFGRTDAETSSNTLATEMNWLNRKGPDAGKYWKEEEKRMTEDEMVGWHHLINRHEFKQASGDGEGQGSWSAAVHGVAKSQTQLSDWKTTHTYMVSFGSRMDDSKIYSSLALASPLYFRCLYSITHLLISQSECPVNFWNLLISCQLSRVWLFFNPMDCRPPGSSVLGGLLVKSCLTLVTPGTVACWGSFIHGILQASILEWVAISFSRGSSWPRN